MALAPQDSGIVQLPEDSGVLDAPRDAEKPGVASQTGREPGRLIHLADHRPVPLSARPELSGSVSITVGADSYEEHLSLKQARRFLEELAEAVEAAEFLEIVGGECQ